MCVNSRVCRGEGGGGFTVCVFARVQGGLFLLIEQGGGGGWPAQRASTAVVWALKSGESSITSPCPARVVIIIIIIIIICW